MTPVIQQSMAAILVLVACAAAFRVMPKEARAAKPAERRPAYVLPDRTILMICVMVFGLCIVEGAIYDWGTFFLREVVKADPATTGMLYATFTIGMGATRMAGDKLRDMFGPVILVRFSALLVAAGIALLVASPGFATIGMGLAALALFTLGCGIALAFPIAVSTTIALGKGQASENLSALALTLMISTIGVPPLLASSPSISACRPLSWFSCPSLPSAS